MYSSTCSLPSTVEQTCSAVLGTPMETELQKWGEGVCVGGPHSQERWEPHLLGIYGIFCVYMPYKSEI